MTRAEKVATRDNMVEKAQGGLEGFTSHSTAIIAALLALYWQQELLRDDA